MCASLCIVGGGASGGDVAGCVVLAGGPRLGPGGGPFSWGLGSAPSACGVGCSGAFPLNGSSGLPDYEEDLVELVECCIHVKTMNHLMLLGCGTNSDGSLRHHITGLNKSEKSLRVIALHDNGQLLVEKCQLSTEMTPRLWSCLRSFTSLNHLTISDSSLSFPPSPPELPSVTKLSAERVTSQSYEGLLSSLPGLRDIDISIDDAERNIAQITAGLRRTGGGQQLTRIKLTAPSSLPSETKSVSRETMRGLGLLIREQTKNLQVLWLYGVECTDEKDLVYLLEFCRHVKTMSELTLNVKWLCNQGKSIPGQSTTTLHR